MHFSLSGLNGTWGLFGLDKLGGTNVMYVFNASVIAHQDQTLAMIIGLANKNLRMKTLRVFETRNPAMAFMLFLKIMEMTSPFISCKTNNK